VGRARTLKEGERDAYLIRSPPMRLAVQQVLPHPFMELLTMADRRWFDRSACELTRNIGRDVQTEEHREQTKHGQDACTTVVQRRQFVHGAQRAQSWPMGAMSRHRWESRMSIPLGLSIRARRRRVRVQMGHRRRRHSRR
jgi:hypothetical protein